MHTIVNDYKGIHFIISYKPAVLLIEIGTPSQDDRQPAMTTSRGRARTTLGWRGPVCGVFVETFDRGDADRKAGCPADWSQVADHANQTGPV